MAKWIEYVPNGFSRDELFAIHESTRNQRNEHRDSIYTQLKFYFTIVSALLATEITLCLFAIPLILNDIKNIYSQITILSFLLILPIGNLVILRNSLKNLKKEYEKLMEYLTVEQKIEAALGLMQPIQVSIQFPEKLPYPEETSILYPRWLEGSYNFDTTTKFVEKMTKQKTVLYIHLKNSLSALCLINIILIIILLLIGIGIGMALFQNPVIPMNMGQNFTAEYAEGVELLIGT